MTEEKFIGYFRLIEACDEPGCPVCRCVTRDSRNYLDALLYEQVTDPDTRRVLRASWGFCNWHTWMLLEIEHSIFGSAIIYEDILTRAVSRADNLGDGGRPSRRRSWLSRWIRLSEATPGSRTDRERATCPACTAASDSERRYLQTLLRLSDEGDLQAAYARSDGLCLPHLFTLAEEREDGEARLIIDKTREKWRKLGQELGSFIAKHDYRNRDPYTEEEAASYRRAFEIVAGARGVFGNDLHLPTRDAPSAGQRLARRTVSRIDTSSRK